MTDQWTGRTAEHRFVFTADDMEAFAAMSGDRSAIHWDDEFAKSTGFDQAIVYGGLMLAKLSHVLGNEIPGNQGLSLSWSIQYHKPLYVDQEAVLRLEVVDFSPGTRLLSGKFRIEESGRLIASGKTQSIVPAE